MESTTWHQVKLVLGRALEYTPSAQRDYVARACGGNEFLQAEVEALLDEVGPVADEFLESPADLPVREEAARELVWVGRRLGAFRIVHHIATGGMGHVYLAQREDGLFQQTVAIKVLRQDVDSPQTRQRLAHERDILARMNHPFIAQLMDGGEVDGLPYMVLAHVEGETIDVHCSNLRLDVHARIALVIDVCAAVSHAHAQGVVHRDIKPRNLLVTSDSKPRLLDFSIAEFLRDTDVSVGRDNAAQQPEGLAMFTPECAAPEQLGVQPATVATDIYALGALLYRLLTGHLPQAEHRGASSLLALHAICREDPVKASAQIERGGAGSTGLPPARQLIRALQGDLDDILAKTLAREPDLRYSSVSAFSDDLRRHLEGRPVTASSRRATSMLGRFVDRITPRRRPLA